MRKLTKTDALGRVEAALAILGEEDCEDAQTDLRLKFSKIALERAIEQPVTEFDKVANDSEVA